MFRSCTLLITFFHRKITRDLQNFSTSLICNPKAIYLPKPGRLRSPFFLLRAKVHRVFCVGDQRSAAPPAVLSGAASHRVRPGDLRDPDSSILKVIKISSLFFIQIVNQK